MASRLLKPLSLLAAAALLVTACSSGGGSPSPSAAAASPSAAAASASAASPSAAAASASPATAACEAGAAAGMTQIPDVVDGKFNIAMVLIGPHNDGGWSQAHYEGLMYLCENMPDVHVAYIENVAEGADSEQVFRSLARKGFNFIIGTSFGYMDPMATVAEEFPDQTFLHLTGYKSNGKNFGNFFGAIENMKYLAGMLAGSRAKLDGNPKIGYMATFASPEEVRLGNAIMLGAKQTCPECTMDIRWINTWHDPVIEKEAAASLFDAGAQVVFTGADTPAVADVAQEKGKWGVTYDWVGSCKVDACLTAPYWIWGPEYTRIAGQVKAGTYKAGYEYFDADSGAMGLFGFMDGQTPQPGITDLPAADVQLVKDTLAKMLAGTFNRFDVFAGPIKDNTGKEILAAGQKLVQADLDQFPPGAEGNPCTVCMQWFAEGINGELPK
ncbi:MAG: BMP family ABC transporter substrate-binding protein [Chloroflexota bacterium]